MSMKDSSRLISLVASACLALAAAFSVQTSFGEGVNGASARRVDRVESRLGLNHKWVERLVQLTNSMARLETRTNSYWHYQPGLHFQDASGALRKSEARWKRVDGAFVADSMQHQVRLASSLSGDGTTQVRLPGGRLLDSHVLEIRYRDAASGRSVTLGRVRKSQGRILQATQVVYPDAFDSVAADIRYTVSTLGIEQDIILREAPPVPESMGLNPETTRIEVLTRFSDAEFATVEAARVDQKWNPSGAPAEVRPIEREDVVVRFGSMQIGRGRAFAQGAESGESLPVGKRWILEDGKRCLVEAIEYRSARPHLAKLPRNGRAVASASPDDLESAPGFALAELQREFQRPGLVLDYLQTLTPQPFRDFVFQGDMTYYVDGELFLEGTTTLEGGAVIKYPPFAGSVWILGRLDCMTSSHRPAILTGRDDDSVGHRIDSSTGFLAGTYGNRGLAWWYSPDPIDLHDVRFVHLGRGLEINSATENRLHSLQMVSRVDYSDSLQPVISNRGEGILVSGGTNHIYNVLFAYLNRAIVGIAPNQAADVNTVTPEMGVMDVAYVTAAGCWSFCNPAVSLYLNGDEPLDAPKRFYRSFSSLRIRNSIVGRTIAAADPRVAGLDVYADAGGAAVPTDQRQTQLDSKGNFWPAEILEFLAPSLAGSYYLKPQGSPVYQALSAAQVPVGETPELSTRDFTTLRPVDLQPEYVDDVVLGDRAEVAADTWRSPGYHYPRIDYLSIASRFNKSVTLTNGVCLGWAYVSAVDLGATGASLYSVGTPEAMNRILNVGQVQEGTPPSGGLGVVTALSAFREVNGSPVQRISSLGQVRLRFTEVNTTAGEFFLLNLLAAYGNNAALPIQSIHISDSQFHGAHLNYSPMNTVPVSVVLKNNLFNRGLVWFGISGWGGAYVGGTPAPLDLEISNNLFRHLHYPPNPEVGWFILAREAQPAKAWTVIDNVFDSTGVQIWGPFAGTFSNNGFSPNVPAIGGLPVVATPQYAVATGGLGGWYQALNPLSGTSAFSNQGSRSAAAAGLARHTARADQARVVNEPVDLGFHYVASQSIGGVVRPLDSDGDQIPDYVEDANENGVVDSAESDPQNSVSPPRRLGLWQFSTPTFASEEGVLPRPGSGIGARLVESFDGNAAAFDGASQPLVYNLAEAEGRRNIDFLSGSIRFTYVPDWTITPSRRPSRTLGLFQCGRWKMIVTNGVSSPELHLFTTINDGLSPTLILPVDVPTSSDLPAGERWGYEVQINYNSQRVWASITKAMDLNAKFQSVSASGIVSDVTDDERASGLWIGGASPDGGGAVLDADGFIDQFETFNVPTERIIVGLQPTPEFQFSSDFGELWNRLSMKRNSIRATDTGTGLRLEWLAAWEGDWKGTSLTNSYRIFRRDVGNHYTLWDGPEVEVVGVDVRTNRWTDTTAVPGRLYEYRIGRLQTSPREARGEEIYEYSPYEHPTLVAGRIGDPLLNRGTVFLVIEESLLDPASEANTSFRPNFKSSLNVYRDDLWKDGWKVIEIPAKRMNDLDWYLPSGRQSWHDNILSIKQQIHSVWSTNPSGNYQIVLLGRVPIPYSGYLPLDGHGYGQPPDHSGAWPADVFYGDMSHMEWRDATNPIFPPGAPGQAPNSCPGDCEDAHPLGGDGYGIQLNSAGDFKYDHQLLPSDSEGGPGGQLEIPVGRIDFAALEYYANPTTLLASPHSTLRLAEYQLLRRYLAKVHNYKLGLRTYPQGVRVYEEDGNFFEMGSTIGNILDRAGYGRESLNTFKQDLFAQSSDILWGIHGGFSSRSTIQGSRPTNYASEELATGAISPRCGFLFLRGSHFVDWNLLDSFGLHCLALSKDVLSVSWIGDAYSGVFCGPYQVDPVAAGMHLGAMQTATYNRINLQQVTGNYLLGDPTLRMKYIAPPTTASAVKVCVGAAGTGTPGAETFAIDVSWTPSSDVVDGYAIYRNEANAAALGSKTEYRKASNWVLKGMVSADQLRFRDASGGLSSDGVVDYMVRAVVRVRTGSGGYSCPSLGSVATCDLTATVCP